MSATAVRPIAIPMSARRASAAGSACTTGEAGWPSSTPKPQAPSMNTPRPVPSITYSGQRARTSLARLLEQLGDEARPARLVTGADAGAVVTVEVLVEEDQVAPVRVGGEALDAPVDRSPAPLVAQEDPCQPARQLGGHLPERHHLPRARREFHLQLAAVEVIEALQRFDEQEVHRKPDRTAPVRVAAEQAAGGLRRLVVDPMPAPLHVQHVRVLGVVA